MPPAPASRACAHRMRFMPRRQPLPPAHCVGPAPGTSTLPAPGALESMLRAAGVGTFIHVGCNVLATLTAAHEILNDWECSNPGKGDPVCVKKPAPSR